MSDQEKWEEVKKFSVGAKVIAKIGDHIIGYDELEMEYYDKKDDEKKVYLKFHIGKSRYNPKGRIDNYLIPMNRLILN